MDGNRRKLATRTSANTVMATGTITSVSMMERGSIGSDITAGTGTTTRPPTSAGKEHEYGHSYHKRTGT